MRWIIAAAIVTLAVAAWALEVLYCMEKDSTGFYWNKGVTEGERTGHQSEPLYREYHLGD